MGFLFFHHFIFLFFYLFIYFFFYFFIFLLFQILFLLFLLFFYFSIFLFFILSFFHFFFFHFFLYFNFSIFLFFHFLFFHFFSFVHFLFFYFFDDVIIHPTPPLPDFLSFPTHPFLIFSSPFHSISTLYCSSCLAEDSRTLADAFQSDAMASDKLGRKYPMIVRLMSFFGAIFRHDVIIVWRPTILNMPIRSLHFRATLSEDFPKIFGRFSEDAGPPFGRRKISDVIFGIMGRKFPTVLLWLYSGKVVVFRQKVVVFGQKWLYSGKRGCIRAKVVVFGQKWFVFGQNSVVFGQKWLYSRKSGCIRAKVVVFKQKWLVFGQK